MDARRVIKFRFSIFIMCMLVGVLSLSASASAHDYQLGPLRIDHPWATATPKGAKVGVGYMKISNDGPQPDRLTAMTSPASRTVTLHASVKEGDVVRMRLLDKGLEIRPGETVELRPAGTHVMFEGLNAPLVAGVRVKGTLVFEKAGSIEVEYAVKPLGSKAPAPAAHTH